jgi:hypothetical protein
MTETSTARAARFGLQHVGLHEVNRHEDNARCEEMLHAADSLALCLFAFIPGMVWFPLPFDTRAASRKRD